MDRNQLIGFTLISILLIVYARLFAPKPLPPVAPVPTDTVANLHAPQQITPPADTSQHHDTEEEQEFVLENDVVQVVLSSKGGHVKQVILKQYTDQHQQPLILLDEASSHLGLLWQANERTVSTSQCIFDPLFASPVKQENGDWHMRFRLLIGPDKYIEHAFTLPQQGYCLRHQWKLTGEPTHKEALHFVAHNLVRNVENDLEACRNRTTIQYYLGDGSFEKLKEGAKNIEQKDLNGPVKWVGLKQRFFTVGLIADHAFQGAQLTTQPTMQPHMVQDMRAQLSLIQPGTETPREGGMTLYLGPNDYHLLKQITPGFEKNLPLGWTVVRWFNAFLIMPLFSFLERYISNYGLIILVLVLIIKMLLLPLSYKSYMSMAKMKVLKPAIDALKAKHGDDAHKLQLAQMQLYREVGINPMSGCVPVLLQMPILLAMFNFFPNLLALRQQPFLWAQDLSTYDAIFHLPFSIPVYGSHVSLFTLLMTGSTLLYTWSNNQMNPPQGPMKSLAYVMPLTFMVILNSFPAGMSFYYFVSNLITFGQQTLIKRLVNEEQVRAKLELHKRTYTEGTKSRFQGRLEAAWKAKGKRKKR